MNASRAHGWAPGSEELATPSAVLDAMPLAFTAVDDLTGWLEHNKLVGCAGGGC